MNFILFIKQLLVCLRYLAKGDFQSECADLHGISQPTVSRIIGSVLLALDSELNNVKFPTTNEEIIKTKTKFFNIANFPGVIGAVDGTLVPILSPKEDEFAFVCRKGFHALNVQGVVDATLRFTNYVCKWPGSVHDSFIFRECRLYELLQNQPLGWLLGDSGYALKSFLMTPKNNPQTEAEEKYNRAHSQTRIVVERAFGVLKSRFRCLHKTGGCLPFAPHKCIKVISVAIKLHNWCIDKKIPLLASDCCQDPQDDAENDIEINIDRDGSQQRERLVQLFA
ncbi:putative nuclease HARBI1 [Saccostrea cucullata]|uniref:putative nuclease HARBI1 n=1 Tax=Saccostrea cuccullata TaxID=36930 RepID=UPI002ED37B17